MQGGQSPIQYRIWILLFLGLEHSLVCIPYVPLILGQLLDLISLSTINISEPRFKSYDPWDMANWPASVLYVDEYKKLQSFIEVLKIWGDFIAQNLYLGTWTHTRERPVLVYVLKMPSTGDKNSLKKHFFSRNELRGSSLVFLITHCPCILPSLT